MRQRSRQLSSLFLKKNLTVGDVPGRGRITLTGVSGPVTFASSRFTSMWVRVRISESIRR
jgi:hypothetical protein